MSKLCKENVGKIFEVEARGFLVEYKIVDSSFDHEFGTREQYDYVIISAWAHENDSDLTIEEAIDKDLET